MLKQTDQNDDIFKTGMVRYKHQLLKANATSSGSFRVTSRQNLPRYRLHQCPSLQQ